MHDQIKAFRIHTVAGKPECRFEKLSIQDLDDGDVTIKVVYSAVNYKDAMAARGIGKNIRTTRPCVAGIDLSGIVLDPGATRFKAGDKVIVTNYKLGTQHDGAYADIARVPMEWIVPMPDSLSLFEAMALGTCGLTAALNVYRLEKAGITPERGPIVVTGATGGVGSLTIDILAKRGYEVVAVSGKSEKHSYLLEIGAQKVLSREEFVKDDAVLAPMLYAAGVANVGGVFLDRMAAQVMPHGVVCLGGMAAGAEWKTTVLPMVLRAVDILGINVSRQLKMNDRRALWSALSQTYKPQHLARIATVIPFNDINITMDRFFDKAITGRIVVDVNAQDDKDSISTKT